MSYEQVESFSDELKMIDLTDNGKRPRMVTELHEGGFVAPHFTYDLIAIPTTVRRKPKPQAFPRPSLPAAPALPDVGGDTSTKKGGASCRL